MTTESPDLFLEDSTLVVFCLSDGLIKAMKNSDTEGKVYESSDIITVFRSEQSDVYHDNDAEEDAAVVLGFAENESEAVKQARTYFRRLLKWDGVEDDSEMKVFGHGLQQIKENSQVDIFDGPEAEGNS